MTGPDGPVVADRAAHRRTVVRGRRVEFYARLAAGAHVCSCRRPGAIDPREKCARCYGGPGGGR
jgi:hypothetical protein